jgi:thiosulfate/3-mercaptopyruvate sulfurtransferase
VLGGPLVCAEWLAAHLDEVVVADVRWYLDGRSGRDAYVQGHIPGAVFVDVDRDLSAPPAPSRGRHPLLEPEEFAQAMSRLGIGDTDYVVAYDDSGGSIAARLWWMLDATGHRAAVLDGGLQAWTGEGGGHPSPGGGQSTRRPLEAGETSRPAATFTPRSWPAELLASVDDIDRLRQDQKALVVDARAPERYSGAVETIDPRAGHIPGARSAPWAGNLDPASGRFSRAEALRGRFAALGADQATQVAVYCGSGVTACHNVLALRLAGIRARLYVGSWSQWSADGTRPTATGERP